MKLIIDISEEAGFDLEDIFDYTCNFHGAQQAVEYVSSFDDIFDQLATYPESGRPRQEIKDGLRSFLKEYHVIFYRILEDRIRIVRILYGARDLPRQFDESL